MPLDDPDARPKRPNNVKLYRHLIYGFAKAHAVLLEGYKDDERRPRRKPREDTSAGEPAPLPGEVVTKSGLIVPEAAADPPAAPEESPEAAQQRAADELRAWLSGDEPSGPP